MAELPILIAGGGIAGLAAALSLARQDYNVAVLEREASFSEAGAGLQLGPNAVAALQAIGAWDAVEPFTFQPPAIHMRDGRSGKLLKRLPLTNAFEQRFGAPYRVVRRVDLHRALLECCKAAAGIELQTNCLVDDFVQSATEVTVNGRLRGTSLVVADGVHSPLRQKLFAGAAPVDSSFVFHRALQLVGAVGGVDLECVTLWMLPGSHVVHYPVGAEGKINIVCVIDRLSSPKSIAESCCLALAEILSQKSWTQWPGLYVKLLPRWQDDRVLLIGDAAHGTLPFLAQGAAMALEDAAAITVSDGRCRIPAARLRRTAKLHIQSVTAVRTYHLASPLAMARNLAFRFLPESFIQDQLAWLYAHKNAES